MVSAADIRAFIGWTAGTLRMVQRWAAEEVADGLADNATVTISAPKTASTTTIRSAGSLHLKLSAASTLSKCVHLYATIFAFRRVLSSAATSSWSVVISKPLEMVERADIAASLRRNDGQVQPSRPVAATPSSAASGGNKNGIFVGRAAAPGQQRRPAVVAVGPPPPPPPPPRNGWAAESEKVLCLARAPPPPPPPSSVAAQRSAVQVGAFASNRQALPAPATALPTGGSFAHHPSAPGAAAAGAGPVWATGRPNCPCCGDGILAEVDRLLMG